MLYVYKSNSDVMDSRDVCFKLIEVRDNQLAKLTSLYFKVVRLVLE